MSPRDVVSRLLARPWTVPLTGWAPHLLPPPVLHGAALVAATHGHTAAADRLYERAALAYQLDGDAEGAARLRTHRMLRALSGTSDPEARAVLAGRIAERVMRGTPVAEIEPPFACFAGEGFGAAADGDAERAAA